MELDRKDLIALVKGSEPSHETMSHPLLKRAGSYNGGFNDSWSWNYFLDEFTDDELMQIYLICKQNDTVQKG